MKTCTLVYIFSLFLSLAFTGCAHESGSLQNQPAGLKAGVEVWNYVYLNAPTKVEEIQVSDETIDFNGKIFSKVISDSRDPYCRGILIEKDHVEWLIEGSPKSNPGIYGVESNSVSRVEGGYIYLNDDSGKEYAKINLK